MVAARLTLNVDPKELSLLQFQLHQLPVKVSRRVFRSASRKAANLVKKSVERLTPRQKKKPKKYAGKPHLQDVWHIKQKTYASKSGGTTVVLIGPQSGQAPHATLVEKGTRQRFTNSQAIYKTLASTKVRTKSGAIKFRRGKKVSVGSKIKRAGAARINRGVMPAIRPLGRAWETTKSQAMSVLTTEIRKGITKEATTKTSVGGL